MNTRRGFFRTLAGIVVGGAGAAVVGPNLKLQNKPIPAPKPSAASPITLAHLQEAYARCCWGGNFPDMITVSPKTYTRVTGLLPPQARFRVFRWGYSGLRINGAMITKAPPGDVGSLAVNRDDEIAVVNWNQPQWPFTHRFRVVDGRLVQGPGDETDVFWLSNPRMSAKITGIGV